MESQWFRGRVKTVPSGDCLVIQAPALQSNNNRIPPERAVTLLAIRATDEPFAWDNGEYLRKLCLGHEVVYSVDGTVFLGNDNVAELVVQNGWAAITSPTTTPYTCNFEFHQDQAFKEGLGLWSKVPGAAEASIRTLPPPLNLESLLTANKGKLIKAIVEQVCDGSFVLLTCFQSFSLSQSFLQELRRPILEPICWKY